MLLRTPEISETIRRQLRIANRVLDIPVPEPRLQRSRIVAGIRQRIAAAMSQHVRVDLEWHRERYGGSLRLAAMLADDPGTTAACAVAWPALRRDGLRRALISATPYRQPKYLSPALRLRALAPQS